jgi:hypothetical protein
MLPAVSAVIIKMPMGNVIDRITVMRTSAVRRTLSAPRIDELFLSAVRLKPRKRQKTTIAGSNPSYND